jgi:hydroxymethylbilane synthase
MRLGTRRSPLALAQARSVAERLGDCEIVEITTSGDRDAGAPGATGVAGDKSRWVAELEQALLDGRVDIAVHSAKDVPGELAAGTVLLAGPARAAAEDVLCGAADLDALAAGSRVGTSSLRRLAQLRAAREDVEVVPLRGNVDTRLRKLSEGADGISAIVIARAGIERLGLAVQAHGALDPDRFVPAPGQGTLALQARSGDTTAGAAAQSLAHAPTFASLLAERALARALAASCEVPLGAHAIEVANGTLRLRAWVGLPDGSAYLVDELDGAAAEPDRLGERVAERMLAAGARELLDSAVSRAGGQAAW